MRNLRIVAFEDTKLPEGLPLTTTAWDKSNNSIIGTFGPTPDKAVIELKRKAKGSDDFTLLASWDAPCPLPDLTCDEVLLLQYFDDVRTACLVLAGGDIVVVRESPTSDQERVEIVGSVDVGIAAAAWAPDEELLAVVTRSDTLVLMSKDFEPVTETTLTAGDLNASKHVSVGWGKKETQFQGKRARGLRDPTVPETVDEGKPSSREDGSTTISWRGDGAYFAVNRPIPDHRRVIRVFSRDGILDSASEPVDGMESAVSWRHHGNLIAGIKRSVDRLQVIFFERNGLRHGQFDLRVTREDMESWAARASLTWNTDSSVLAVSFSDRTQLWTMGNYHYYLKQEIHNNPASIVFESDDDDDDDDDDDIEDAGFVVGESINKVRWHPEEPLRVQILAPYVLLDITCLAQVVRGPVISPSDDGLVAVIDGKKLCVTPLKQANVPPPMSFCHATFDHSIVDCAFSATGDQIAVVTTIAYGVWWLRRPPTRFAAGDDLTTAQRPKYAPVDNDDEKLEIPLDSHQAEDVSIRGLRFTQVAVLENNRIYVLAPQQEASEAMLIWIRKTLGDTSLALSVPASTQRILTDTHQHRLWASSTSSTKLLATSKEPEGSAEGAIWQDVSPDSKIFTRSAIPPHLTNGHTEVADHKVSLSANGALSVDDCVLARDCSSYVISDAHLIFTTTLHFIKFVHLDEPTQMVVPGNQAEVDERCRSIEAGAKIVTVMPSAYAVVLQMPRGNLETIYPRILVLSGIRQHLKELKYREAFLACQNHQVDMNILHDYQPAVFLSNVEKFLVQVKKTSRIDEFLSKLKEEDVTNTLYKDTLLELDSKDDAKQNDPQVSPVSLPGEGKVNRICDAVLHILSANASKNLQNIITAHVCKRPPDLTAALTLVSTLRKTSEDEADLAISHLCFLTDANRLYDAALALYDLQVTLMVAQNAQRDPREYMPFLENLQALPPLRRQYTINNHLRKYAKGLTSLHALSAHDEVEAYTVKHNLYTHALALYKHSPTHHAHMTRLHAEHLAAHSQPLHAAHLYESLSDHTSAYPLYALAHAWRESLTCATLIPLPSSELHSLATQLATTLTDETRDYRSAATIHLQYLSSASTAATLLCCGSYFSEATRLLSLHSLPRLIPTIIDPALTSKFSEILSLIADCRTQLMSQVPRILDLREIKTADPLAFFGGDATTTTLLADDDNLDNISLAPTDSTVANNSLFTRYDGSNKSRFAGTVASNVSRKTSKTKRKEERKRARGKKGSVYEEEYLVGSVRRLIERVNGVHEEVGRLVAGLVRRGMGERAERVVEVVRGVVGECEGAKSKVWVEERRVDDGGVGRPNGADGVFWDSQQAGEERVGKMEAPEVKVWKGGDVFGL